MYFCFFSTLCPLPPRSAGALSARGPFSWKLQLGYAVVYHTALVTGLSSPRAALLRPRGGGCTTVSIWKAAVGLQVAIINSCVNGSRGCRFHLAWAARAAEQAGNDNTRVTRGRQGRAPSVSAVAATLHEKARGRSSGPRHDAVRTAAAAALISSLIIKKKGREQQYGGLFVRWYNWPTLNFFLELF